MPTDQSDTDGRPSGEVIGAAGPGEPSYREARINADGGDAAVDLEAKADAVARGEGEDPAVANADPARLDGDEVSPPETLADPDD